MIPGIDILMLFCRKITNFLVQNKFKVCVVFDRVGAEQYNVVLMVFLNLNVIWSILMEKQTVALFYDCEVDLEATHGSDFHSHLSLVPCNLSSKN